MIEIERFLLIVCFAMIAFNPRMNLPLARNRSPVFEIVLFRQKVSHANVKIEIINTTVFPDVYKLKNGAVIYYIKTSGEREKIN